LPVDLKKPISEENTLEEECEDEMITVPPFSIEPVHEVIFYPSCYNSLFWGVVKIGNKKYRKINV